MSEQSVVMMLIIVLFTSFGSVVGMLLLMLLRDIRETKNFRKEMDARWERIFASLERRRRD
jgi:hypothetical protein